MLHNSNTRFKITQGHLLFDLPLVNNTNLHPNSRCFQDITDYWRVFAVDRGCFFLTRSFGLNVGKAPCYLSDALQLTSTRVTRSDLRSSSDTTSYPIPHLKTKFGERAFSFAGPVTWNRLPAELRSISDSTVLKNKLKTYLFNMAFNV